MSCKPELSWAALLSAAPYFHSVIHDVLTDDTDIQTLSPPLRAALYYDIFDGEVSNGGVAQYFFNQAFHLPGFERAPEFMAESPVFAPVMALVREAHDAWDECRDDVAAARAENEWPEELLEKYAPKFEALQTAFYAINNVVAQRLCHDIIKNPDAYFAMETLAGVPAKGVAHVSVNGNTVRLRFVDGFPIGPNIFERGDGRYNTVRFDLQRSMMECSDATRHCLIHYPSMRTVDMHFKRGALERWDTTRAFWYRHGLRETFSNAGDVALSEIIQDGRELATTYYYPSGQVSLTITRQEKGERYARYWPNGNLNVDYVKGDDDVCRYFRCHAEDGTDLAPAGTGKLIEIFGEADGKRIWGEGTLAKGRLTGALVRYEQDLATGKIKKQ